MLEDIIPSEKLSTSFKVYLLEVAIRRYINLKEKLNLNDVASLFKTAVIRGANFQTKLSYRAALQDVFGRIDHRMRHDAKEFEEELAASLADAQEGICSASRNLSGHS